MVTTAWLPASNTSELNRPMTVGSLLIPVSGPRLPRRLVQLAVGLVLFGVGIAMMLRSELGVPPWDVLHQGLADRFGATVGTWSILVSILVLVVWIPLREPYGVGTLANAVVIGVVIDLGTAVIPTPAETPGKLALVAAGIVTIGVATGLYIGARLGPGPRDGLMTGIARRGPSLRVTRTAIEVSVLTTGWALGGTFGIGTVAFALGIGPIVQVTLPLLTVRDRAGTIS